MAGPAAPTAGPPPTVEAAALPSRAAAAAPQPPGSQLSRRQQLALAEAAITDVRTIQSAGKRLVEALADASAATPSELQSQVSSLLQTAAPALERAQAGWAVLRRQADAADSRQAREEVNDEERAAEEAVVESCVLGAIQQQAAELAAASGARAPSILGRATEVAALQALASRVSRATRHRVELLHTAPKASGLPGQLAACASADASQVHLTLAGTLVACIALAQPGSVEPVRLAVFSAEEGSSGSRVDAWAQSKHLVFQRISTWGMQALGFFQQRAQQPEAAASLEETDQRLLHSAISGAPLEDLLLWLCTYSDLFTRRCAATGTLLAADAASQHLFPPLVRPFGLSRAELLEAARERVGGSGGGSGGGEKGRQGPAEGVRQAFHPHAAPLHVLQQHQPRC